MESEYMENLNGGLFQDRNMNTVTMENLMIMVNLLKKEC